MEVRFSVGHRLGGTDDLSLSVGEARAVLDALLAELEAVDDEHYQVFVVKAADQGITVLNNGICMFN